MKDMNLQKTDPEVWSLIGEELERQRNGIELIASENYPSLASMEAAGSVLCCKYAEGYPEHRYYGGCEVIDKVEQLAIDRAKQLFGCEHANVQPHSGTSANLAVYSALLQPGARIMAMSLQDGGHLSFGTKLSLSGKVYTVQHYGVNPETGLLDYDEIEKMAMEFKPLLLLCGASAYPREIDFERFRHIADKCGALLMADMSHIAGLVAAGLHMSPVPYADIVTTTCHKTLRCNRGAFILCKKEFAKSIDRGVFPMMQGGPLEHMIAAKAVGLGEALKPEFRHYQHQILKNIKAMEKVFSGTCIDMVTGGSDNHLLLLDLRRIGITGREAEERLAQCGMTVNKNMIPGDPYTAKDCGGIRIGTAAITSRGMKEAEAGVIASLIDCVLNTHSESTLNMAKKKVEELTKRFPLYEGLDTGR